MNKLTSTLLAGTVLASTSFSASAHNWGGFYAGAFLSVGNSSNDWRGTMGPETVTRSLDGTDTGGGVYGGYNFPSGNFVFGAEAEIGSLSASNHKQFPATFDGTEGFDLESTMDWLGSVRGRAGFVFQDALFYVLAGVAFSDLEHNWIGQHLLTPDTAASKDADTGYVLGGGFDLPVEERLAIRGEVCYYDFGKVSGQPGGGYSETFTVDSTITLLRLGVAYEF